MGRKKWLAHLRERVWFAMMRPVGNHVGQTIARSRKLATLLLLGLASAGVAQEPDRPTGTGVQIPSNEGLIERANKSSVKADAIWIEITKLGSEASRWVVDLNRNGSCFVIQDAAGRRQISGGKGVLPKGLVERTFTELTKRSVIYGERGSQISQAGDRELVAVGMATFDGSRVYKTQSGTLGSYPEPVQAIVRDLRQAVGKLPPNTSSMGSIQSTFLRPAEARRMIQAGRRVVTVEDPGRDAREITTLQMALRIPGRDIVVPTANDWAALKTYVLASNPEDPESGEFFVQSSSRIFLVKMNEASAAAAAGSESGGIPRAKPLR